MNAIPSSTRFFLRTITLLIALGGLGRMISAVVQWGQWLELAAWVKVYPQETALIHYIGTFLAGFIMLLACRDMWYFRKKGLYLYAGGKVALLVVEISAICYWTYSTGRGFLWESVLLYVLVWLIYALILVLHKKYYSYGIQLA